MFFMVLTLKRLETHLPSVLTFSCLIYLKTAIPKYLKSQTVCPYLYVCSHKSHVIMTDSSAVELSVGQLCL